MKKLLTSLSVAGMMALSGAANASSIWFGDVPVSSVMAQGIAIDVNKEGGKARLYVDFKRCQLTLANTAYDVVSCKDETIVGSHLTTEHGTFMMVARIQKTGNYIELSISQHGENYASLSKGSTAIK